MSDNQVALLPCGNCNGTGLVDELTCTYCEGDCVMDNAPAEAVTGDVERPVGIRTALNDIDVVLRAFDKYGRQKMETLMGYMVRMEAALAAARTADFQRGNDKGCREWKPIETAPKDGRQMLLRNSRIPCWVGHYIQSLEDKGRYPWSAQWYGGRKEHPGFPTEWMEFPLFSPTTITEQKG